MTDEIPETTQIANEEVAEVKKDSEPIARTPVSAKKVKSEPESQDNTLLYAAGAAVIGFLFWKWNK